MSILSRVSDRRSEDDTTRQPTGSCCGPVELVVDDDEQEASA